MYEKRKPYVLLMVEASLPTVWSVRKETTTPYRADWPNKKSYLWMNLGLLWVHNFYLLYRQHLVHYRIKDPVWLAKPQIISLDIILSKLGGP